MAYYSWLATNWFLLPNRIKGNCSYSAAKKNRIGTPIAFYGGMNWYALYVKSRHEFVAERELSRKSVETFLPVVNKLRRWKDRDKWINLNDHICENSGFPTNRPAYRQAGLGNDYAKPCGICWIYTCTKANRSNLKFTLWPCRAMLL